MFGIPAGYLITFHTYGTWVHGDERGSVDRKHKSFGSPYLAPDPRRADAEVHRLTHDAIVLNDRQRTLVRGAIHAACRHRGWVLHALNARTNHVHVVVSADRSPERVMNALKSWSTRRMVETGCLPSGIKPWTRHGSTRYLWKDSDLRDACRYVLEGQGVDLPEAPSSMISSEPRP